jgi:hypothetical protein
MPFKPTDRVVIRYVIASGHAYDTIQMTYRQARRVLPSFNKWEGGLRGVIVRYTPKHQRSLKAAQRRIAELEDLVSHCWVHSGYPDCGRQQMDRHQRRLYDEIRNREPE